MVKIINVEKLYFANPDTLRDLFIGLIAGLGYLLLISLAPLFAIGIPSIQASAGEMWRTVVIGAPLAEELMWSIVLPWVLLFGIPMLLSFTNIKFFKSISENKILWIVIAFAVLMASFSIFHATAYAGSLDAQAIKQTSGLFIGAMFFRFLAFGLLLFTQNFWTNVIFHGIVNFGISTSQSVVVLS